MPFKVAVVDKFCQNILHERGNGAGVKSEVVMETFNKMLGENHISNTEGRGDRF